MKKTILIIILISLYLTTKAQVSGNLNYNDNNHSQRTIRNNPPPNAQLLGEHTMVFTVNALVNAKADAHLAIFNITQVGLTAAEADNLLNKRLDAFRLAAQKLAISNDNFYVDMVSLVPVYEYEVVKKIFSKNYNEVPKGFELQKNIHIVFKESAVLDRIVSIAAQQEIYDLVKVEYFVEDTEKVYDQLRDESVALINKKLASFKKLGIELDTVFRVVAEASNVAFPIERYQKYQAYNSTSVDAIKKRDVVKNTQKQTSMFYEKLPYNGYDIVINPVMLEPAVQYTYNLKVQFFIKQNTPKTTVKREKEFVWLTPDGKAQTIKIE